MNQTNPAESNNYNGPSLEKLIDFKPILSNDDGPMFVPMCIPATRTMVATLFDVGSFGNLMDEKFARDQDFEFLDDTLEITGVSGATRSIAKVRVEVHIGLARMKRTVWHIIQNLPQPTILGRPSINAFCKDVKMDFESQLISFHGQAGISTVPYITNPAQEKFPASYLSSQRLLPTQQSNLQAKLQQLESKYQLKINTSEISNDELEKLTDCFLRNEKVFSTDEQSIGIFNGFKGRIKTTPGKTAYVPQYRIPEIYEKPVQNELDQMLRDNVIVECPQNKAFNTPITAVMKPNGKDIRIVCNFKVTLNPILEEEDTFSIPRMEDEIIKIGNGNKYFCTIDVKSGYWHVLLDERDQYKTSFYFKNQNFMWTRFPFGLRSSGAVFCRAIAYALRNVKNKQYIRLYVDDIMVHTPTFQLFLQTIDQVLKALKHHGILISGKKASILNEPVKWLGRLVDRNGVRADPENVSGIKAMVEPKNLKQLMSLIGALNWVRQFASIKYGEDITKNAFSIIAKPITDLLRGKKFKWTEEASQAFIKLKEKLSSPAVIHYADFSKPFYLLTDASLTGIGYVLLQPIGEKWSIIRVGSKKLTDTQMRWSTIEREAFGVIT